MVAATVKSLGRRRRRLVRRSFHHYLCALLRNELSFRAVVHHPAWLRNWGHVRLLTFAPLIWLSLTHSSRLQNVL